MENHLSKRAMKGAAVVAATVGGGFAASQAQGGVVYTPLNATVDKNNVSVPLDFDGDGTTDALIEYSATSGLTLNKNDQTLTYIAIANGDVAALPFGESIGPTVPAGDSYDGLNILGSSAPLNGDFTSSSGQGYIGLDLGLSSQVGNFYGWIGFQVTNDSSADSLAGKINGFAYESSSQPISAGAVPEPTSLGLLAMGAIGLLGYRRRGSRARI